MDSPLNTPYTMPTAISRLPYTAVRSHNTTRYEEEMTVSLADYIAALAAAVHPNTTPFDAPPVLPMNFVRRGFLEDQGSPEGRLQEIAAVFMPQNDPRAMAMKLGITSTGPVAPHIASPGDRAIRDGMVPPPYRMQRRGRGFSTLLPLRNVTAPPAQMYESSASALALSHLQQQERVSLGPTLDFVYQQQQQSVGGR